MITFILVFFFGAFLPYFDFQHKKEGTVGDMIINNLTELDRLTLEQENISKSIQNYLDRPTLAAINDYKTLNDYFRRLELLQSQALVSSNNLSVSQLETIVPTFLVCNEDFYLNMSNWVSCNAKIVAESTNNKISPRYQPIVTQILPFADKARQNLKDFNLTASYLISDQNNEITSKLPPGTDSELWKQKISDSLTNMINWESKVNYTRYLFSDKNATKSIAWTILGNPGGYDLTYTDYDRKEFKKVLDLLNQSKNEIQRGIKGLTEKFEQVEFPVFGKVPVGLANAIIIYPAAIGVGFLVCSYYLGQTISKRSLLHRKSNGKFGTNFGAEMYPLWVEPLDTKKLSFAKLILFVSVPLLFLLITSYLIFSIPIKQESIFGIALDLVLLFSSSIGLILLALGVIIIALKSFGYRSS